MLNYAIKAISSGPLVSLIVASKRYAAVAPRSKWLYWSKRLILMWLDERDGRTITRLFTRHLLNLQAPKPAAMILAWFISPQAPWVTQRWYCIHKPAIPSAIPSPQNTGSTCTGTSQRWVGPIAKIDIPLPYLRRKLSQSCRVQPNAIRTIATFSRFTHQLHSHVPIRYYIQVFYRHVLRYGIECIDSSMHT